MLGEREMLKVLPPKLEIDINSKIRLNVLAGVLDEMTKVCGTKIEKDLKKGVVDRDVIEKIHVNFIDKKREIQEGIVFQIDWERFELIAKDDTGKVLYSTVDFSKNLCNQLDKRLYDGMKLYVNRLKRKYKISKVECSFTYREKYRINEEIHCLTEKYMGHERISGDLKPTNSGFKNEITAVFKGVGGALSVIFKG